MNTTTTHRGTPAAKSLGGAMLETTCREFAAQYPTPNVRRAIVLAESGRITWEQVAQLFGQALTAGLAAVAS